eukprot:Hpha_TRINITY_DN16377_c2_g5::TRINITY_DN16377_c2_g5_i1::g.58123::m.58123
MMTYPIGSPAAAMGMGGQVVFVPFTPGQMPGMMGANQGLAMAGQQVMLMPTPVMCVAPSMTAPGSVPAPGEESKDEGSEGKSRLEHESLFTGIVTADKLNPPQEPPSPDMSDADAAFPLTRESHNVYEDDNGVQLTTVIVELRYRRRRVAECEISVSRGDHVILDMTRGHDMGVVVETHAGRPHKRKERPRVTRLATAAELQIFKKNLPRDEEDALVIARELVQEHGVPLVVHCVSFQFDRRRAELHYSSQLDHPDFRNLLDALHTRFKCRVWLNNCRPKVGHPGEPIPARFIKPRGGNKDRIERDGAE